MGLLNGLQRFSQGVSGLLFPGMGAAGVDPQTAQLARSQALMSLGAGLLGGQDAGRAYNMGQVSGWEPIEQARREAALRADAQERTANADWRNFQRGRIEASDAEAASDKARDAALLGQIQPLLQSGDYEGVSRILAGAGRFAEAQQALKLGKPGLDLQTQAGPNGGTIISDGERWQYIKPERPAVVVTGGGSGEAAKPPKPLPTSALRIVDDAKQAITAASQSKALVDGAIKTLQSGGVELGAVQNLESRARNFAGMSDKNSRAYADIRQTLEKLRNNYLLLAKGVQTEGDAQRAWNSEIGENVQNDNALALQQLTKAQTMIDSALEAQQSRIDNVYANYGTEAPATAAPVQQGKPVLKSAPPAAIEYLRQHPEAAPAFKQKYGYLPGE